MENYMCNENDLFNNPMVESAKKAMDPKHIEDLRIKGESMYKDIDFENGTIEHVLEDSFFKLNEELKSGLHPSYLEESELAILQDKLGDEWYKKYGYVKDDLNDIVTIKK